MTAPEPRAMTLEERELVVNVLRNYHRDHAGDPEFGAWPQIAHRLAGRLAAPATQRDPTTELVEALKEVREQIRAYFEYDGGEGNLEAALDTIDDTLREAGVTDDA